MSPGASQTPFLESSSARCGVSQMRGSVTALDSSSGGGLQVTYQRPAHKAAQRVAVYEVPDICFKKVRATFTYATSIYLLNTCWEPGAA